MMSHPGVSHGHGSVSTITVAHREGTVPDVGPDEPASHVVRLSLLQCDRRLRQNDSEARQGDPEGVHRMRTASRRLRSVLRLFRELIEGDWAERLEDELKWLGRLLGAVRDSDVMRMRLLEVADGLSEDLGPLFDSLSAQHDKAVASLRDALEGPRYRDLLVSLSEAVEHATFGDDAEDPCRSSLPPLAQRAWKRLASSGRALDLSDDDEAYHEVRKRAKYTRYAAECIAPHLDSDPAHAARRFAKRALAVQNILGEHQDAIIACREIQRTAAERSQDGRFNLAAGRLLEREETAAHASRTRFFKVWHKLDSKKNRGWMKP